MFKNIHLIILVYGLGFFSLLKASTFTVTQFDTVESTSPNTTATSNIILTTTTNSLTDGIGVNEVSVDYRGEVSFASQDANGPFWVEKSKDSHMLSNVTGYFEGNVDECIESQDFYGEITEVGSRQGDVYTTDNGTKFRIGPFPTGTAAVSSGSSGTNVLPKGWASNNRATELSFLTTGTHDIDDASTNLASYTVTISYDSGDVVYIIDIPRDNGSTQGSMSDDSSGNGICNLGGLDTWCVAPHSTTTSASRPGESACLCDDTEGNDDADDDKCWILEVRVFLDSTEQINDVIIIWTDFDETSFAIGLNGPLALTTEVTEATYDNLFIYDGEFVTTTSDLDAGGSAIWYAMEWDQSNSNGQIRMAFDCGDASNGSDFTSADWGEDNAEFYPFQSNLNNPTFDLKSATATSEDPASYQNHCYGRYAEFSAYLLDPFIADIANNSPQLDSVTLFFARDTDGDTYPETTFTGSNSMDCFDSDNNTFPGSAENESSTDCMTDKDGDGYGSMIKPIGSNSAWVSGIDCNDNSSGSTSTTWYADCDGDEYGDVANSIIGCDSPPSTNTNVCTGGADPLAYVNNTSDCDDTDSTTYPGAAEIESGSQCMQDQDNDGYGNSNASVGVTDGTDCNDLSTPIHPGALEICDNIDNDCNNLTDDDDANIVDQILWCADNDEDTFGTIDITQLSCDMPNGYVFDCTDCDDSNMAIHSDCEVPIFKNGFE